MACTEKSFKSASHFMVAASALLLPLRNPAFNARGSWVLSKNLPCCFSCGFADPSRFCMGASCSKKSRMALELEGWHLKAKGPKDRLAVARSAKLFLQLFKSISAKFKVYSCFTLNQHKWTAALMQAPLSTGKLPIKHWLIRLATWGLRIVCCDVAIENVLMGTGLVPTVPKQT